MMHYFATYLWGCLDISQVGCRCLLSVWILFFVIPLDKVSGDAEQPKPSAAPSAQCGIYAVYGALHLLGIDCNFYDLVSVKYVSTPLGSTLDDLKLAIEDHGGYALPMKNLSLAELRAAESPMILHFSPEGSYGEYNHWVLFLGFREGEARLIDSQDFALHLSPAELLARWDGIGLIASKHPLSVLKAAYPSWATWLQVAVLALTIFWGLHIVFPALASRKQTFTKSKSLRKSVALLLSGCVAVALASSGIAWAFHKAAPEGFLNNKGLIESIASSKDPDYFRHIDIASLERMIQSVMVQRNVEFGRTSFSY